LRRSRLKALRAREEEAERVCKEPWISGPVDSHAPIATPVGLDVLTSLDDGPSAAAGDVREVPFTDLRTPQLKDEIMAAWGEILDGAAFIGGPYVASFEENLARYTGAAYAVGVANGTDAITLALRAMGIEPGDEVITAANTFYATVEAIVHAGGSPVLVDVDPITATLDPELVERAITSRTRFVIPVHLYGQPASMDEISALADHYGLKVLEDAAQALGATYHNERVGSLGHAAAISFYPGKNLGACGDAGAVTTDDPDIAANIRALRDHGQRDKNDHRLVGYNSRLDALQAAALDVKLRHLDDWSGARRQVAAGYNRHLAHLDIELPVELPDRTHVYHLYVITHEQRDSLREKLAADGIQTGIHYPTPIHLTEPFRHLGKGPGAFLESERRSRTSLSLPMYPHMSQAEQEAVCLSVEAFLGMGQD
jgi:dTDP-4-amino-4,6-dideoxygalactose transaminase